MVNKEHNANEIMSNQIPTLEQAKNYIYSLNFDQIISKQVNQGEWSENYAMKICQYYRNFLFLNKKYEHQYGPLPPSEEIDDFWHNHILDTQKYAKDSQMIFGYFFHHYPYLGIDDKTTMHDLNKFFEVVQWLHFKEFGDYIYSINVNPLKQLSQFVRSLIALLKLRVISLKKNLTRKQNQIMIGSSEEEINSRR